MIMQISDDDINKVLIDDGLIAEDKLAELKNRALSEKTDLKSLLISENIITEKALYEIYAKKLGVPFVEVEIKDLKPDVLRQIPENIAKLYNMIIFDGDVNSPEKHIAMEDPDDLQALDILHKMFGQIF